MLRKYFVITVLVMLMLLGAQAIVQGQSSSTLTVFAAASLTDAFEEIATIFEDQNPGVDVLYNFGSSSSLATQLVEGAPADVFASANNTQMNVARDAGRIAGQTRTFVKNRLVLIVPASNPANIQSLLDLANAGVKLVVAAPGVPVRDYTDTMLQWLAGDPGYGEAYQQAVIANIASEEDNVRQVSAKVALGEADAGIVYVSDVTPDISDQVIKIGIPDALNTIATYPIGITDNAADPSLAQAFVNLVLSGDGQDVLVKWNFISVQIPKLPATIQVSSDVTVDGQVYNPLTLTIDYLKQNYTAHTVDVSYQSGENTVNANFTGVLLWDVISAAQPNLNADTRNDKLSTYIVVTASDGYQAVIAWGEIDPEFANQPILVAYRQDGQTIQDEQGPIRLVVPGDQRGGRYVSGIVNISLRDAPHAAQ